MNAVKMPCVGLLLATTLQAVALGPEDEVKAAFRRFVEAQNAHDLKAVERMLLDSPDFLWVTRTAPLWGRDAAVKRFEMIYKGTWRMEPEGALVKVVMLGADAAQLYAPVRFTVGPQGQTAQSALYMYNETFVKTKEGWKVASIVPVIVPPAP